MTRFYVGTAGWSYLRWDKEFYPKGVAREDKLAFYASCFNVVELNNSFYHTPTQAQFSKWEAQTPAHFLFAVKAPRFITHTKKLKEPAATLPPFLDAVKVQKQPGPVFFQLPPTFPLRLERMESFLKQLPLARRYAVELRDPAWHIPPVYALLKRHKVAFCLFDTPEGSSPRVQTADFSYVRLRGRKARGLGAFLREWRDWLEENTQEAYVFFDNREEKRLAFGNALAFTALTQQSSLQ